MINDCSVVVRFHAQTKGLSVKIIGQELRNMTRFSVYQGLSVPVANPPTLVGGCSVDEIKEIVKSANGDIRVISEKLGTRWTDPDMRIQVFHGDPYSAGFRIPDGNVAGTDKELWIPGGKTSGGYHELSGPPISGDVVDSYTIQQFMEAFLQ